MFALHTAVLSKPSFYHLAWHTSDCFNKCKALVIKLQGPNELDKVWQGFQQISLEGCIVFFNALQHLLIRHLKMWNLIFQGNMYRVNIQAMRDADSQFLIVSVTESGKQIILLQFKRYLSSQALVEALRYFIRKGCAYSLSEHVIITPHSGPQHYCESSDDFILFHHSYESKLRWHLDCCVNHTTTHSSRINPCQPKQHEKLFHGCFKLHNFCIDETEPIVQIQ
jgi:hypothetical protein